MQRPPVLLEQQSSRYAYVHCPVTSASRSASTQKKTDVVEANVVLANTKYILVTLLAVSAGQHHQSGHGYRSHRLSAYRPTASRFPR